MSKKKRKRKRDKAIRALGGQRQLEILEAQFLENMMIERNWALSTTFSYNPNAETEDFYFQGEIENDKESTL